MPRVLPASSSSPSPPAADSADEALTDVVGSILLVGLTVVMTVVLAGLLLVYDGPEAPPQADLAVTLSPGVGGWGTGDEEVRIRHLGGPAVPASSHVLLDNGTASWDLTGAALGGAFADGELAIGETWRRTARIHASALVSVQVSASTGSSSVLLASLSLVPGGGP